MASRSIKNRPSAKKKHPILILLVFFAVFAAVVVAGGVSVYALGQSWIGEYKDYDVSDVDNLNASEPSEVYANDSSTLLAKFQLEDREPIQMDQINDFVKKGTIATEDERFYHHGGFDLMGIARAAFVNLTGVGREGASTITQQFVRNTILSKEMDDISFKRKVREMYLSVKLEEKYSKEDILHMYLNTINYGSGAYGIQAAAKRYFSKNASDLTLVEAATLIGIPQSPTYNNPIDHSDICLSRRNLVLDRMLSNGYISQQDHDAAQALPISLNPTVPSVDGLLKYPYFASYVKNQLVDTYQLSHDEIWKGGLKIITTLDPSMQDEAEAAAAKKEKGVSDVLSVALVAVDPSTGYIKAMVGDKDWSKSQVNLADSHRQPGSSFKTFTLVAALEQGISPQTLVNCGSKASFPGWSVFNIDNHNYGTISMARAFAKSSNTGFARLIMSLGPDKVAEVAHRMGIKSELRAQGTLTLGESEVTAVEMASAYATIANGGTYYEPTPIVSIADSKGKILYDNSDASKRGTRALTPEIAHAAEKVMEGVVSSSEGTGVDASLPSGQVVAGKTGTTSNYKDIYFCGITPKLSVAVWMGDKENIVSVPEHETVDDVFRNFVSAVLKGQKNESFLTAADPPYKDYSDKKYDIGGFANSDTTKPNTGTEQKNEVEKQTPKPDDSGTSDGKDVTPSGGGDSGDDDKGGGGDNPDGGGDDPTPTPPTPPDPPTPSPTPDD